jgi:rhomboid protease GluP
VDDGLLAALYAVVLAAGWAAGQLLRPPERKPWATLVALVVVGVPSLVQLTAAPGLLHALERRPDELADGKLWRLVTSLVVQDGGWPGAVFNLVGLLVVGVVAERVWGPLRWTVIWLVAGVGAQFWGLVVQPRGGGNSVATFGLAASLAVRAVLRGDGRARLAGAVSLLAGVVLLVVGDVHGGAVVLGAAVALVFLSRPGRPSVPGGRWRRSRAAP